MNVGSIRDDLAYGGVRAILKIHLAGARLSLQIDVEFGNAITPEAAEGGQVIFRPAAVRLMEDGGIEKALRGGTLPSDGLRGFG